LMCQPASLLGLSEQGSSDLKCQRKLRTPDESHSDQRSLFSLVPLLY